MFLECNWPIHDVRGASMWRFDTYDRKTMTDALLSPSDKKEELSRVYARAVAAGAGYVTSVPDYDRDGIDLQIRAGGAMRPAIDVQLKATVTLRDRGGGHYRFPLPKRNFDLLRENTQTPRLLVVLALPKQEERWLTLTTKKLILRRCAFWANLKGHPETRNQRTITVSLKEQNRFDVEGLRHLMELSRKGTIQ